MLQDGGQYPGLVRPGCAGSVRPGIGLRTELDPAVPHVNLDPEHMKRALINLVDNAVEAVSPAGEVIVETAWLPESRRARIVVAAVAWALYAALAWRERRRILRSTRPGGT